MGRTRWKLDAAVKTRIVSEARREDATVAEPEV